MDRIRKKCRVPLTHHGTYGYPLRVLIGLDGANPPRQLLAPFRNQIGTADCCHTTAPTTSGVAPRSLLSDKLLWIMNFPGAGLHPGLAYWGSRN